MTHTFEYAKRAGDIIVSLLAVILLAPVLVALALSILIEDGTPVLFKQVRVGRGSSLFTIYKFRSMPVTTPTLASAEAGQLPVTRIGRLIRRTSLDELPQLLNVLRGDMSIVGPRPALPSQSALLNVRIANGSSELRPGITGLAQVRGFDGMSEEEKGMVDGQYARHSSFSLDLSIILSTLRYLISSPPTV